MTAPIGVIINPNARGVARDRGLAARLRTVVGRDGEVVETYSPAQLAAAIDRFAARGCDLVASCGGDGTNLTNPGDYRPYLRALLDALDAWVRDGTPPPPSVYPRIDQGTLVPWIRDQRSDRRQLVPLDHVERKSRSCHLPDARRGLDDDLRNRDPRRQRRQSDGQPDTAAQRAADPRSRGGRITGCAPFVSNCHDAHWTATTATVMAGDPSRAEGEPEVVMAYLPRESCHVIDTWHVMGMRGTGSNDVAVTDVFVPMTRTFPLVPEFTPGSHYQGPLYRFPLVGIVATNLPPLVLTVARRAIEEVSALAQGLGLADKPGSGAFYLPLTPNGRGVADGWAASGDGDAKNPEPISLLVVSVHDGEQLGDGSAQHVFQHPASVRSGQGL